MATFKKKHGAYAKRAAAKQRHARQDQFNALVETMVIAACIDGVLAPGEAEALAALVLDTPGFEKLDNKGLAKAVESITTRIAAEGLEKRVKWIARALGDDVALREEAFTLATMFVHYDGE